MRGFVLAAAALALASCGQPPAAPAATGSAPEQTSSATIRKTPRSTVEGWQTDITAYPLAGETLPPFTAKQDNGTELTQANLRDRWTIIGFQQSTDNADEGRYIAALNSAADQDPDLDFLGVTIVRNAPAPKHEGKLWPHIDDNGALADALRVDKTPAYLLIGPDLTIEGYRGALTDTTDDGIKSVIRGYGEIRKQIAAPE
ncbi:MAG: hypothetical protein QM773_15235 [Hyphomonadaceae bacterium]